MRPGQLRPGIHAVLESLRRSVPASMRPGQLRPGIPGRHRQETARQGCFNEAGAASPRNTIDVTCCSLREFFSSFNEAGAASPRNTTAKLDAGTAAKKLQ